MTALTLGGKGRLFDLKPKVRWTGTRALVLRGSLDCACGPIYDGVHTQPALFSFGGHGAAERIRARWCLCGRVEIRDTTPMNPRRL